MKKGFLIAIIAVIGIDVGLGIGMDKKGSNSINNIVKSSANNGTSNNFNNNSSNNGVSIGSGNESNSNGSSSNGGDSSSNSSSNTTSSSLQSKATIGLKNQAALSSLAPQYLDEFANIINQSNQITLRTNKGSINEMTNAQYQVANLWMNELSKLYSNIEENLTPEEISLLKQEQDAWSNYKENAMNHYANQTSLQSSLDKATQYSNIIQERCYYLFFYYLDNNDNTNLDLRKLLNLEDITSINETQNSANKFISSMGTSASDLATDYNVLNNMWTDEINGTYEILSNQYGSDAAGYYLKTPELEWINAKSNEMNIAGEFYNSDSMKLIAEYKVSIALTKARTFILTNELDN